MIKTRGRDGSEGNVFAAVRQSHDLVVGTQGGGDHGEGDLDSST